MSTRRFTRSRFVSRRKLLVGVIGIAAIVGPLAVAETGGGGSVLHSSAAAATTQPFITYNQTTGKSGSYIAYTDSNNTTTTQSVTSGGGCATPSPTGAPLLGFAGWLYDSTYQNLVGSVPVGAYKQRTGVCSLGQAWSIDNVPSGSKTGAEALDFSVGSNPLVAGQLMVQALIDLQRSDSVSGAVTVQLLESLQGTPVATQCYSLPTTGTMVQVDTNAPTASVPCTSGDPTTGFDRIEIRVITPNGSVSVVGPSSKFYLAPQICGGTTLTTSSIDPTYGTVKFTVTFKAASTVCKSYTSFGITENTNSPVKSASFYSYGSGGEPFTFTIDWGLLPKCTPDGSDGNPPCPVTLVTTDNSSSSPNLAPQTYCAQASLPLQPLCTVARDYDYSTAGYTDIYEVWSGLIDSYFRL